MGFVYHIQQKGLSFSYVYFGSMYPRTLHLTLFLETFYISKVTCRAQNNGQSTANVRPKIVFVRPNLAMTGHVRSLFFLYLLCILHVITQLKLIFSRSYLIWQRKYVFSSNCSSTNYIHLFHYYIKCSSKMKASAYKHIKPFCCNVLHFKKADETRVPLFKIRNNFKKEYYSY